jgi:glycosyltransferase involved in cell wall biosynthesis
MDYELFFSVIIPVFNRPDEVDELLHSLTLQSRTNFEVIVVEDGSTLPCREVTDKYVQQLDIAYYVKPNSGPGQSRNYGAERSRGDYLIILDSDCILPKDYFKSIEQELRTVPVDAFGGPDRAHESFTAVQKAISYSMTSFFTTGGIRGGKKKMDRFYPRSFKMGIRTGVYRTLNGFCPRRVGEDIDFSIRIFKGGYSCRLFPEAWVYHKRRTDLKKFFKQVHNSGIARINLYKRYPESLRLVHLLPAGFTAGIALFLVGVTSMCICLIILYAFLIACDATLRNKSLRIGIYSVAAAFVQLIGYGTGFWRAWWVRCVCRRDEFSAFNRSFYK